MAHKCFISFKTEDMDYKKKIQEDMDIDMIDKSLDEPINSDDEDYIMRKIREDYLADSTVTIYLIGEYSAENSFLQDQTYIKRELQASLYNGENKLEKEKIYYFAYIKFFKMDNQLYGIVAGKTKSKLVNRTSDVNFTKNLKYAPKTKWNAKEFLALNNLEWEKSKILVIIPKQTRVELKKKEAKQIENWLQKEFNLFGS